jgi:nucleoside-diphosphate-sugar epimerase
MSRVFVTGGTLLSIEKARQRLGYEPEFSWRDAITS